MASQIKLGNIAVDVVLKDIKNVHLSVYPPTGRVRISAPKRTNMKAIREFPDILFLPMVRHIPRVKDEPLCMGQEIFAEHG